ncbi:MAG TPA: helix-turn-helix domain-containing protein, partial [Nocardioides sp.]|nr:helix-turn-helix domain-containing protein [Nocardioides sp.]
MTDDGSFGQRLRVLRERAGLSQEALAARAGLSPKAVGLLERGERRHPYPNTVAALADGLGATANERAALVAAARRTPVPRAPASVRSWPAAPTPLVGRDAELRELGGLLVAEGTRLVTLTGTGGVGKTRLALALLEQVAHTFPDGATFVPLAPVDDPGLVAPTLVRALGLAESGRHPLEALEDYLAGRRVLLVLDNLEHLLDAAPDVARLVASTEALVVLATSRAPLRVRGEVEHPVGPLWVPESEQPSVEAVGGSPAGRLFVDRAREASPAFELTEVNAADVAAICRRLAGLPLALEIAAARSRHVGPGQLLSRLDRALHAEGARDLPERHRTLHRTLEWSHDLLDTDDRALFARLSVFAGGFELDAAEAVGGDVLDGLGRLVEHSLVMAERTGPAGAVRYRMLEPVRQYAAERLAAGGGEEAARLHHALHYLDLAEQASPLVEGAEQVRWLDRLTLENDNFRTAIAWSVRAGRSDLA